MTLPPPQETRTVSTRKKHWSDSRTFGAAVFMLLVLVSAALWWQHAHSTSRLRAETAAQAQLRAAQVASASAAAVSILFRAVDTTARELSAAYAQAGGAGFGEPVRKAIEHLPQGAILQVAVIGADGYLAYSNLGMGERVFLGDREHFSVHRESVRDQLFISKPLMGRVSRQWSIQFSRPILRGGRFDGVVVLSVSPAYLQEALADITLDSDDAITVLRQSGEFLASNRESSATLGKAADPARPYLLAGAPSSGSFIAPSEIDQVERLAHWQRLDHYPVVVLLGLSSTRAFQPVERAIADDQFKTVAGLAALWLAAGGLVLLAQRFNAQMRRREELEYLAMNDMLTGLHSRHALMNHLTRALSGAALKGSSVGVLYLDLNGFKPVNDQYGHAAGDQVLKAVGGRIKGCVRGNDVVARIGGDEFVVVLDPLVDDEALAQLADRIAQALQAPISVAGVEVHIGASMGLASFPKDGATADALLVHADHEMYQRKGRDAWVSPVAA